MIARISEALGAKVGSTKEQTHPCHVAEKVLVAIAESANLNQLFSGYEYPIKASQYLYQKMGLPLTSLSRLQGLRLNVFQW